MIVAVYRRQEEALAGLTRSRLGGGGGRTALWWYPILSLDAERIAYITARTVASKKTAQSDRSSTVSRAAVAISNAIRQERNFQIWRAAQNDAEEDGVINMAKLMLTRVSSVDSRTAAKWMKKGEEFDKIEWTLEEKLTLGTVLIGLLIQVTMPIDGNQERLFEVKMTPIGRGRKFKTEYHLEMTQAVRKFIAKRNEAEEFLRPWLLPMLSPPNDWREVDAE